MSDVPTDDKNKQLIFMPTLPKLFGCLNRIDINLCELNSKEYIALSISDDLT